MWKPAELGEIIAERTFVLKSSGLRNKRVVVRFGRPVRGSDVPAGDPWWCPLQIAGMGSDTLRPVAGIDSLQALALALQLVERLLRAEAKRLGCRVDWLGEEKWPVFGGTDWLEAQADAISTLTGALSDAIVTLESDRPNLKSKSLLMRQLRGIVERRGFGPRSRTPRQLRGPARRAPRR